MSDKNTLFWLETAESIAKRQYGGQYTLMCFQGGYRFCFGIVDHRYDIDKMAAGATMVDAIMLGVINETRAVNRVLYDPQETKAPETYAEQPKENSIEESIDD